MEGSTPFKRGSAMPDCEGPPSRFESPSRCTSRELKRSAEQLARSIRGGGFSGRVELGYPLAPLTTYKLGGAALLYVEPSSYEDLLVLRDALRSVASLPVVVLGRGSNVLVSDLGVEAVVVRLGQGFSFIEFEGTEVTAGAIVPLPLLAKACAEKGLEGMEFGTGIPASVGGAVAMNAGGHGSEISRVLVTAKIFSFEEGSKELSKEQLALSYRSSALEPGEIVTEARFGLERGDPDAIRERMLEIARWRRENQPGGWPCAGSMFKNPPGTSAGLLIDKCGLKGKRVGGAEVSTKHANFILAHPGASAEDVARLMASVREEVAQRTGYLLELEVRLIGDFGEVGRSLMQSDSILATGDGGSIVV